MKLPSVQALGDKAMQTFMRFPLSMISAMIGCLTALQMLEATRYYDNPEYMFMLNRLLVCSLGLTMFTALTLWSEVHRHSKPLKFGLQVVAAVVLIVYLYSLPVDTYTRYDILRFMIYAFCGHLLVSFLPYLRRYEPDGFWEYNKSLFLRFLTAALYSAVLYGGLAIALLAVDQLFNADIDDKSYFRLWLLIATIFNTWFFLSGVPDDFPGLNERHVYPKGLKIFTQFVLLPIITIYMAILYAYMMKIIFTGTWPEGWVSWLVLSFSVAGILALLLIWPIRNEEGHAWIRMYSKGFFIALFPLVILLFLSIRIRVQAYGITEGRYYVFVLALWLAATAAYFLFSKKKSIKVIPLSLFVVGLLSVHGPWSAFAVGKASQLSRLKMYLDRNGMLQHGKAVAAKDTIDRKDQLEIIEKIDYLCDVHGYRSLQDLFVQNLDSVMVPDSGSRYVNEGSRTLALLNLTYINNYDPNSDIQQYFYFGTQEKKTVSVAGYDYRSVIDLSDQDEPDTLQLDDRTLLVHFDKKAGTLQFRMDADTLVFDLPSIADSVLATQQGEYNRYDTPVSLMTRSQTAKDLRLRIRMLNFSGNYMVQEKRWEINSGTVEVLTSY